ncbi:MAG: DUF4339 domain-containing protein, partial [Pirellulaceae bacterium]|nr:DUF4339 domain-containing protein [Pirellulaceae bacterium]
MWYVRIGSRLRGPFTEDQLKLLRKRGELSSVHQVSQDQRVWEPAGTLFQQWEGKGVEPAVESPAKPAITPTTTQDAWYFSSPKGESVGPMSRQHLGQLAAAGQITSRTLIYGPGYSSWTAAGQVDFLKLSPQKKSRGLALPIALVTCLSLALVGTAGYVVYLTGGFADASGAREVGSESGEVSNVSKPDSKQTLASSNSKSRKAGSKGASADATLTEAMEERLTNATGLVYLCTRCTLGSRVIDLTPLSSGTCFVVTKEGGIVTNRHVVDIQPEIAKNPKLAEVIQAQKTDCESKGGKYSIGVYVFLGEMKW